MGWDRRSGIQGGSGIIDQQICQLHKGQCELFVDWAYAKRLTKTNCKKEKTKWRLHRSVRKGVPSKEKPVQFFNHFVNRIIFYFLFSFSVCCFSVAVIVVFVASFQYIKILCVLFVVVVVHVYLYSISYIGTIPHIYVCKVLHEKNHFLYINILYIFCIVYI